MKINFIPKVMFVQYQLFLLKYRKAVSGADASQSESEFSCRENYYNRYNFSIFFQDCFITFHHLVQLVTAQFSMVISAFYCLMNDSPCFGATFLARLRLGCFKN